MLIKVFSYYALKFNIVLVFFCGTNKGDMWEDVS